MNNNKQEKHIETTIEQLKIALREKQQCIDSLISERTNMISTHRSNLEYYKDVISELEGKLELGIKHK